MDPDSLLIGVVGHISRKTMAHALADRVDAAVLNIDTTRGDHEESLAACVANHFEVMQQLHALATDPEDLHPWIVVLEDDAQPIDDFRIHAAAALEHAPQPIAGLYIGSATYSDRNLAARQECLAAGKSWLAASHLLSAVAYAIRANLLNGLLHHYPLFTPGATVEARIGQWAQLRRGGNDSPRFCYPAPSLVNHSDCDSIIFEGAIGAGRRAWRVGVADRWDTNAIEYD